MSKDIIKNMTDNQKNGRQILQIIYMISDLHQEYIKNSDNSIIKRKLNLNMGERSESHLFKEDTQMAKEPMERCSTPVLIRKIQLQTR